MDDLCLTSANTDNDTEVEVEEYEEIIDHLNYRTPSQSRSASPEMVTRSAFPTCSTSQGPTVEVSRGLHAVATASITDTVWPDLRSTNPELAVKEPCPVSAT